jgi:uncharacterized protein YbaP (TraB family)
LKQRPHIDLLTQRIFLTLLVCGLPFFNFSQTQTSGATHQLLWKISGKGIKKPSYLFGTFHSNDPRVFQFTDSTYTALFRSEGVVIEADMYSMFSQIDTRLATPTLTFDAAGTPSTTSRRATKTRYGNEDGRPQFLDLYLQMYAYNTRKKCLFLESIEDQIAAYEMLNKSRFPAISTPTQNVTQEKFLEAYLQGDIERIRKMIENQLSNTKDGYQWLINERNYVMLDGIDTLCKKQGLFIAVGAAHLAGPNGLIQLLRDKGYKVRQVAASFSGKPTNIINSFHQENNFTYRDSLAGFSVNFGGKPLVQKNESYTEIIYQEMGQGNTFRIEIEPSYRNYTLQQYVESVFNTPEKAVIRQIEMPNKSIAYEGISKQYGIGNCWQRIFIHRGQLFKVSCYGGNKFMNSKRYQTFFDRVMLF